MAATLDAGFGTVTGTSAAPNTLFLAGTTNQFDRGNAYSIANTDTTNWLFVKIPAMNEPPLVVLPGERLVVVNGPNNGNNITKVVGWATTPLSAATASIVAVGSIIALR